MEEKFKDIIGLIVLVGGIIMGLKRNFMYANNPGTTKLFIFMLAVIFFVVFCEIRKRHPKQKNIKNVPPEFEKIYQELYGNKLSGLEEKRKKVIISFILGVMAFGIAICGILFRNFLLILGGILVALLMIGNNKKEENYISTYKNDIVNKFIKLIDNKLEYKTENIDVLAIRKDYRDANFSSELFDIFKADDYISGLLNNEVYTEMSDLHIRRKEEFYDDDGRRKEIFVDVFQGIYTKTECNKDIGTYIKIFKNQFKIFGKKDRVEMDSQEFEKYFDIYSENKILTMRILTSDIMATLVDFYNKYKIDYEIVIKNNKIHMRFFTGAMFEPKILGNSMDKDLLLKYYCILKFIVDVTKEVNKVLQEIEI